jgi:hypothetical protein
MDVLKRRLAHATRGRKSTKRTTKRASAKKRPAPRKRHTKTRAS